MDFLAKFLLKWGHENFFHRNDRVTKFWPYDRIYNTIWVQWESPIFADIIKILIVFIKIKKKRLKKKWKELEIMYQNSVYDCISSWYTKICWFPVKKYWYQQKSRSVLSDLYIVWIFFR